MALATGADTKRDSRGVAAADLDRDGRIDLVIANNNAPPTILMNYLSSAGRWVELELVGSTSNRDAVGAAVRLTAGGTTMVRTVEAGSGYSAQSAHTLHFGIADAAELELLEVRWPSGEVEVLSGEELNRLVPINVRSRLAEGRERASAVDRLTVRWPSGQVEEFTGIEARRLARVTEGEGIELLDLPGTGLAGRPDSPIEAP